MIIVKQRISIFIDESGDFGFIKEASKYYIITLVFHSQAIDIYPNIEKIKKYPIFHAGPIIRREYPFENESLEDRKKIFQAVFMFTLGLPIKCKSFIYEKKQFSQDVMKMERRMIRDIYQFLMDFESELINNEIVIYYDNGQHNVSRILNFAFAITPYQFEFKKEVHPGNYRLFQVADFISTVRLLELKMEKNELSNSELKFIDKRHLKKNYIKGINRKIIKNKQE